MPLRNNLPDTPNFDSYNIDVSKVTIQLPFDIRGNYIPYKMLSIWRPDFDNEMTETLVQVNSSCKLWSNITCNITPPGTSNYLKEIYP